MLIFVYGVVVAFLIIVFLDPVLVLWPNSLWALDDFPIVDWIPVIAALLG